MLKELNSNINENTKRPVKKAVTEMQTDYENSLQIIKDNNAKMCNLIIDIVKVIIPEAQIVPE